MLEITKNVTPAELRCGLGVACPAAYQLKDGSFLIIGKSVNSADIPPDVTAKMATHEAAIIIPKELLTITS